MDNNIGIFTASYLCRFL